MLGSLTILSCLATPVWSFSGLPLGASTRSSTDLRVAVDPTVVTKKEYQDICGVDFDDESMKQRLQSTNFLYPKHVEVITDLEPMAETMVQNMVSGTLCICLSMENV